MKPILLLIAACSISSQIISQTKSHTFSISGGNFFVGPAHGVWGAAAFEKRLKNKNQQPGKIAFGPELFFENGARTAVAFNPTAEQFINESFVHESNTGLGAKVSCYPFNGLVSGFYIAAAPLIVYAVRTAEKRAERTQYTPNLVYRMSEMSSESKVLGGYRLNAGYDLYFGSWLAGARVDFVKYSTKDLNSLWGLKVGYRL